MCSVSNIGDQYGQDWPKRWPNIDPPAMPNPNIPWTQPAIPWQIPPEVTKEEFDKLKKEVEELKILLKAAKKYDEATDQKDCEMDQKVDFIKQIADAVGVDLGDVFGNS